MNFEVCIIFTTYLPSYLNTIRYLDSLVHDPASNEYYWVASSDNLIGLYQVVLYILLLLSSKMEMVGMTFRNQIRNSCTYPIPFVM